jgi:hypothetical protein
VNASLSFPLSQCCVPTGYAEEHFTKTAASNPHLLQQQLHTHLKGNKGNQEKWISFLVLSVQQWEL